MQDSFAFCVHNDETRIKGIESDPIEHPTYNRKERTHDTEKCVSFSTFFHREYQCIVQFASPTNKSEIGNTPLGSATEPPIYGVVMYVTITVVDFVQSIPDRASRSSSLSLPAFGQSYEYFAFPCCLPSRVVRLLGVTHAAVGPFLQVLLLQASALASPPGLLYHYKHKHVWDFVQFPLTRPLLTPVFLVYSSLGKHKCLLVAVHVGKMEACGGRKRRFSSRSCASEPLDTTGRRSLVPPSFTHFIISRMKAVRSVWPLSLLHSTGTGAFKTYIPYCGIEKHDRIQCCEKGA